MKATPLVLLGALVCLSGNAWPISPQPNLQQLNHRAFTSAEGAPSNIFALAQSSDGTLWIGGGTGLTRFDGIRFIPYPGPSEELLPSTSISSLIAGPGGGLWIGYDRGGVSFLKGGNAINYGEIDGAPLGYVRQFAWARDGALWAASEGGLARFQNDRWERFEKVPELGAPLGILVDRSGTLWLATDSGLFARVSGERKFRLVDDRVFDAATAGVVLSAAPDGTVWAATREAILRIDPGEDLRAPHIVTVQGIGGGPLLQDADGNLWGGHKEPGILVRVPNRQLVSNGQSELVVQPEQFSRVDRFTAGGVFAILEDRERNIWVGTGLGLNRFSHSNVLRTDATCTWGAIAAGDDGAVWIACYSGVATPMQEVRQIRGGVIVNRQIAPAFSVAYRDPSGTIWFGGDSVLGRAVRGRIVTEPLPIELRARPVQALVRDAEGAMWVSVYDKDVFRFHDGKWSKRGDLDALPSGWSIVQTADESGILWFGYPGNRIARVAGRDVQLFDATLGLELGNISSILAESELVWAGGDLGLAFLANGRFVQIQSASTLPFKWITGIVRARNGDLWLNGMNGISRVPSEEVERVMRDPKHRVESETFNHFDGVPGPTTQHASQPTAVLASDGRIWFTMAGGIVSIDSTHLVRNTLIPPVTIWALTSGPRRYSILDSELVLPIRTTSVQIEYGAGSLTAPEQVNFRYKLEGSDAIWQDVGSRREAQYTNLSPGSYTFRVTASNNDGIWNETGASIRFTIPPAIYQTLWFDLLFALACTALLAALYRVRVRKVAGQVRARLEARLAERERIARELHDTLLQGMQGLIWRFQAAAERIAPGEPAREMLDQSLDRADKLLEESRDKVKELRPVTTNDFDLAQVLALAGVELAQGNPAQFRVNEQGATRSLHPIAREEILLIAREALGNAFRHSGAGTIEIDVTYGDTALQIRIRDDGQGIATGILDAGGKPGHFGLVGIRERATKLGAHLQIWTKLGAGTEVDMRVPADVAYRRPGKDSDGKRLWLADFRFK